MLLITCDDTKSMYSYCKFYHVKFEKLLKLMQLSKRMDILE